jgi:4-amino-4-deoxy-L-arabinose transferase-like glycosyltransferase
MRRWGLGALYGLALLLASLALFVPGRAQLPPIDRDESRYMEATAQMLEKGDYVDVRFQDKPRYLQPAGIYWLEAAAVAAFGAPGTREPWAYRLPSLAGAVVAVLLTGWIGGTLFGANAGLLAGLLLGASVLLSVESRMATIDATLLAVVLTAQAVLLRVYLRRDGPEPTGRPVAALYWAALGVGLMLKGPVILLVSWGTILALLVSERRGGWLRRLHPAWGVPLMLAIVLPWCIAIWWVSDGAFFENAVGHNFLGKVATGQQAHGLPPGYYLAVFNGAFWPGSIFAVLALPFVWTERRRPAVRFLLCWIVPTWLVFELVATKLPHYVLQVYPAIACLAAGAAVTPGAWRTGTTWRWIGRIYGVIWFATAAALAVAGPVLLAVLEQRYDVLPILAALAVIVLTAGALGFVWRHRVWQAAGLASLAAMVLYGSTYGLVLPNLAAIWVSPRVAQAVAATRPCPDSVVASSTFSEPSLVFLVGERTRLVNPAEAADHLAADKACNLALIGTRDIAAFTARLEAVGLKPVPRATISGVNYSTGRRLDLTLFQAETASAS